MYESSEYALQEYEDVIKLYKAGKPVDFDELPCPIGKLPLLYDILVHAYIHTYVYLNQTTRIHIQRTHTYKKDRQTKKQKKCTTQKNTKDYKCYEKKISQTRQC